MVNCLWQHVFTFGNTCPKKSGGGPPDFLPRLDSRVNETQFCKPGGVVLVGNGHAPLVNLSDRNPWSWHMVCRLAVATSKRICALHQSGPPGTHERTKWLEPGLPTRRLGGIVYAHSFSHS